MPKEKKTESLSDKSALLSLSSLMSKLLALVATMIVVRMLDEVSYATYKETFLAFDFLLPFLSFGLSHGLYYFLPAEKDRVRGRIMDCYTIYFFTGALFGLFIVFGGNQLLADKFNNPEIAELLYWMLPYTLITLMSECTTVIFNIMNRVRSYMLFNVVCGTFTSGSLIVAMLIFPTAKSAVIATTAARMIQGILSIILTIRISPPGSIRPSFSAMRGILAFSLPLGLAAAVGTITKQIDSLFIASMMDPADYALYSAGAHELPIIGVVVSSINAAMLPVLRRYVKEGKLQECGDMFYRATRRIASLLMPIMCFLWVWSSEFITIIFSEKYIGAVWIFRVYLSYFVLRVSVTGSIFTALGMGKYVFKRTIATCVLNSVLNYIFIKLFGAIGAALATVLSIGIIFVVSIVPTMSKSLGIPKRRTYPTAMVFFSVVIGMICAYVSKIFICDPFITKLVDWIDISGRLDISKTFDLGIYFVLSCIVFTALFAIAALTFMHKDYIWILKKLKEYFLRIFKRKKPAKE